MSAPAAVDARHPAGWAHQPVPWPAQHRLCQRFDHARPTRIADAVDLLGDRAVRRAPPTLRAVDADEAEGATFAGLVDGAAATVVRDVVAPDEIERLLMALRAVRPRGRTPALWALGTPWFAYGTEHADAYATAAARTNQLIQQLVPGLHRRLVEWCARVQGEPVARREGWGGPGVVVFPAATAAGTCGDVHFDWEGVIREPDGLATETYSLISVISTPEHGGGLRVWGVGGGGDGPVVSAGEAEAAGDAVVDYRPGDVAVIDGCDLHQIDAFHGARDRACLTFHVARLAQGWRVWL